MSSLPPLPSLQVPRGGDKTSLPQASTPGGHLSASSANSSPSSDPSSVGSSSSASYGSTSPSNQSAAGNDEQNAEGHVVHWTKKPRRKRSGWGPYQSVLNERSVDFNLTLDVQNLQQEIQTMQTYRELLATKTLIQRHDPSGSLVRIVHEHYRIFRIGFNAQRTGRKRLSLSEDDQKQFLYSIFDENVDCGAGPGGENQRGIGVMVHQIKLYTVFIKAIAMTLTSFEVVMTDDGGVLVATKGVLHFQILRNTIAGMFPHVLGEEWLMSKLVGKEVAPETSINFYFNKHNKVCRFAADLDYVKTFAGVLSSPEEVDILLGRALITEDCILLPNDEGLALAQPGAVSEPESPPAAATTPTANAPGVGSVNKGSSAGSSSPSDSVSGTEGDAEDLGISGSSASDSDHSSGSKPTSPAVRASLSVQQSGTTPATTRGSKPATATQTHSQASQQTSTPAPPSAPPTAPVAPAPAVRRGPMTPVDHFSHVVQMYFRVFANGISSHHTATGTPGVDEFLTRYFSPTVEYGDAVGRQVLHDRWRSLSWCFDVLSFRERSQTQAAPRVIYEPQQNRYRIQTRAEYTLQLTLRSVELVFPHVVSDLALTDALVGARVVVLSELSFWLERGTGLLAKVSERMGFGDAFAGVVCDPEDLAFVLRGAEPILTSFVGQIRSGAAASALTKESSVASSTSSSSSSSSSHRSERSPSPSSPGDSQTSDTEAKMRISTILG